MNKECEILNISKARVGVFLMPMLFVVVTMVSLSGCREKPPIPKEGDIVVWKHNSELIIKAKLGQRREHVIADPRTDHFFYEPEYERFIGQFPIDYKPKPFPKFTEQEQMAFEVEYATKLHAVKSGHPIQFNLMLNGVVVKATDRSIVSRKALDDINQVRVELGGLGLSYDITHTSKYHHENFVKSKLNKTWHYDKQSSDEYDMKCYRENNGGSRSRPWCFGESTYAGASGVSFTIFSTNWVLASSSEPIYGGIKVRYRIDRSMLKHWKEVDAAIWDLLERWNISRLKADIKN